MKLNGMELRGFMLRPLQLRRIAGVMCAVFSAAMLMGADGAWLDRISEKDHARVNPLLRDARHAQEAASAGRQVFHAECAKCHGEDGRGRYARPSVISTRVARASDGDLFWLMNNGVPWQGMPPWMMLPATERWQLVTYLRSLNVTPKTPVEEQVTTSPQGASR